MSDKTTVDSNILLYAHDLDADEKQDIAQELLGELWASHNGVLSPQVLQEFYVNATRKLATPLAKPFAQSIVEKYANWCIDTTSAEVLSAFRIEREAKISFWDALICASALKSGATVLLSEDMNSGKKIAGLRIQNPFAE
jgi:predicted nucleic acid-binding protein